MSAERFPLPDTEPDRACSQCCPGHDRGDGRCERHARSIVSDAERERLYPSPALPSNPSKRKPRGHVERAIAAGKRPFLTCTIDPETFRALDRLAYARNLSRGRLIDAAIAILASAEECPADASGEACSASSVLPSPVDPSEAAARS